MVRPDLPPSLHYPSLHFTTPKYPSRYSPIYPHHCATLHFASLHHPKIPFMVCPDLHPHFTILHFTSPPPNTLQGTPRFTPFTALPFTSLHSTFSQFTTHPHNNTTNGYLNCPFNPAHKISTQIPNLLLQFTRFCNSVTT
jgi:hypothetical protein